MTLGTVDKLQSVTSIATYKCSIQIMAFNLIYSSSSHLLLFYLFIYFFLLLLLYYYYYYYYCHHFVVVVFTIIFYCCCFYYLLSSSSSFVVVFFTITLNKIQGIHEYEILIALPMYVRHLLTYKFWYV